MKKILILVLTAFFCASCTRTEKSFIETEDAYFGLTPPGLIPEVFASGIASDTSWAEHCQIAISPDGKEIYWSAWSSKYPPTDGKGNIEQIYFSQFKNGAWTKPALAEFIRGNPHGLNGGPVFSPDGNRLFFYQVKSPWVSSDMNTYYVEKKDGKWSNEPIDVGTPYNTEKQDYSPIFSKEGIAYKNLFGKIAKFTYKNGRFTLSDSLVIQEGFRQLWNFYMSPNEDYVIFADLRDEGYGDIDLYISFKTEANKWGTPINMGPEINTELRERFPMVSPDGKYLFFMRHTKTQDFFWVSTDIIDELRKPEK